MNAFLVCFIFCVGVSLAYPQHYIEHHAGPAQYEFKYGVEDPHTHDIKSQEEHRNDKELSGIYTLNEADGTVRIVKYFTGAHGGFNAVVERHGVAHHPGPKGHENYGATSQVHVTHYGNGY